MTEISFSGLFPKADEAAWRERVAKVLKGADFEKKLVAHSADGFAIQPIYRAAENAPSITTRQGPWRIVQRVDLAEPESAAEQAREDLIGGADGLAITLVGAAAARGRGLDVATLDELDLALADIRLDWIDLRFDPTVLGRVNAALAAALVQRRGHAPAALSFSFGIDPVGVLATRGMLPAGWAEIARRLGEVAVTLAARGFRGPFALADGRPWHEAGASQGQELAAVLATGVAYLRCLEQAGLTLEAARQGVAFLLVADTDEFLTIAKFRAMRRLWARLEEACGISPAPIRLDAETAWRSLSKRDPHVNMLRGTIAAFAAGIGGADGVTVLPFTSALGEPDGFARRIARNTQAILIEEAHLAKVADPAAGAGGFEALTEALCETAWAAFQEIEREGGVAASLMAGALQRRIAVTRQARERAIATRREPITGASEFPHLAEAKVALTTPTRPPERRAPQPGIEPTLPFAELIAAFIKGGARGGGGGAPPAGASCEKLPSLRLAEPFEFLRDRSDGHLAKTGARPRVFLAGLGRLADHTARLAFARNLFEAGGLETIASDPVETANAEALAALAQAFRQSGARFACLCGADAAYGALAAATTGALKSAGAPFVYRAGRPADAKSSNREVAGDGFIFVGCDALAILRQAHSLAGLTA